MRSFCKTRRRPRPPQSGNWPIKDDRRRAMPLAGGGEEKPCMEYRVTKVLKYQTWKLSCESFTFPTLNFIQPCVDGWRSIGFYVHWTLKYSACRFRDKLAQRDLSTKQHKWVFNIPWKILCMQPPCRVYGSWERGEEETDWTEKSRCGVERSETFFRFPWKELALSRSARLLEPNATNVLWRTIMVAISR